MAKSTQGTGAKILALSKDRIAVPGVGQYNPLDATLFMLPKKTCIIGSSRRAELTGSVTSPGPQYLPELQQVKRQSRKLTIAKKLEESRDKSRNSPSPCHYNLSTEFDSQHKSTLAFSLRKRTKIREKDEVPAANVYNPKISTIYNSKNGPKIGTGKQRGD